MSVADRIAIIANGELLEQGTPREIYSNPKNKFTAEFIGEKNIFKGKVLDFNKKEGIYKVNDTIKIANLNYDIKIKQEIYLSIKSESINIIKKNKTEKSISKNDETINGTVSEITFLGQFVRYLVVLNNGKEIQVRTKHNK